MNNRRSFSTSANDFLKETLNFPDTTFPMLWLPLWKPSVYPPNPCLSTSENSHFWGILWKCAAQHKFKLLSTSGLMCPCVSTAQVRRRRTPERRPETSRERPECCTNLHGCACRSSGHSLKTRLPSLLSSCGLVKREGKWLHGSLVDTFTTSRPTYSNIEEMNNFES